MNTKIIFSLGTSVLLATSLLASPTQSYMHKCDGSSCKEKKMQREGHEHHKGHEMVKMFMKLDLSDQQREKIHSILKDSMKNREKPSMAFSDSSFNKEKFISICKQKQANKIEHKAELIEKIYNVLNSSQKKDFKTMLDMREVMMKNKRMREPRHF